MSKFPPIAVSFQEDWDVNNIHAVSVSRLRSNRYFQLVVCRCCKTSRGVHKIFDFDFDFDFGSFNHLEIEFKSHKMIAELHFTPGEKNVLWELKKMTNSIILKKNSNRSQTDRQTPLHSMKKHLWYNINITKIKFWHHRVKFNEYYMWTDNELVFISIVQEFIRIMTFLYIYSLVIHLLWRGGGGGLVSCQTQVWWEVSYPSPKSTMW